MTKFVNFINNNTIMNSFVLSVLKVLLIIIPLAIGLCSYSYLEVDFCKSLFLYSVPLAFDMALRIDKLSKDKGNDGLLFAGVIILFVFSAFLIFVGFVGIFYKDFFAQRMPFIVNYPCIVYAGVFSQSVWYSIESVGLLSILVLKKYAKKTPVKITVDEQKAKQQYQQNKYKANEYNI